MRSHVFFPVSATINMGVSKYQGPEHRPDIVGLLMVRTPTKGPPMYPNSVFWDSGTCWGRLGPVLASSGGELLKILRTVGPCRAASRMALEFCQKACTGDRVMQRPTTTPRGAEFVEKHVWNPFKILHLDLGYRCLCLCLCPKITVLYFHQHPTKPHVPLSTGALIRTPDSGSRPYLQEFSSQKRLCWWLNRKSPSTQT